MHASAACRLARKKSRAGSMNATFDSLTSLTHSSFTPFIPYPHSRHHRSTRTHVLLSLSPHTIRRRHAAASSCTSCVPHGRTTGPTSPGTALLCYSDVFCVCFVRPSAQGRLLLRVLRAFRLLRCVKLSYQLAKQRRQALSGKRNQESGSGDAGISAGFRDPLSLRGVATERCRRKRRRSGVRKPVGPGTSGRKRAGGGSDGRIRQQTLWGSAGH